MKKFIIFDLDDTLLNDKKEVTSFTLDTLSNLRSMGCYIVINTARSHLYNEVYTQTIKADYTILNGGAAILDKDFNEIYTCAIDKEKVNRLLPELLSVSKSISVQSNDFVYTNSKTFTRFDAKYTDFENYTCQFDAYKIIADISDEDAELIANKFNLSYFSYFGGDLKRFNHKNSTKAKANVYLTALLGGSIDDAIVFGDDLGDIEMIREAGVGVIMKNAKESAKALCKTVSEYTNNEDGVARFLISYFGLDRL